MEIERLLANLAALVVLLLLSGFFSGSETALSSLSKVDIERLRRDRKRSSSANIVGFTDNPRRLFNTILLGNAFINTAFATITASLVALIAGGAHSTSALVIGTLVITLLLLMFGEITPKSIAVRFAERFARITSRPLWMFSVLVTPVRAVLRAILSILLPIFRVGPAAQRARITTDDVKAIVSAEEALPQAERHMLAGILELSDIEAREVMIPRIDVQAVPETITIGKAVARTRECGFSRLPVYRESIDDVFGIFYVKDVSLWRLGESKDLTIAEFLKRRASQRGPRATALVRSPFFAFEEKKVSQLLTELGRAHTKMAVLVDEYGGVAGIVTIEDIFEQIVGDILGEHDRAAATGRITAVADRPRVYEVPGRSSIRSVNAELGLQITGDDADTVGGYLLGLFEHVPAVGEHVTDGQDVRYQVVTMERNRIETLIVALPAAQDGEG